jgi:non-specific serine/threonine protein kinase/serine/threonine-protein kinase
MYFALGMEMCPLVESIANRYEVEKLLGKGATGKVYLVKDKLEKGEKLALKLLEAPGARHLELMRHEFSILTKQRHPNIARVYDFGFDEESGLWFYTTEYIEGEGIIEACKSLDFSGKSRLFAQVLRALQHIHSKGIIHYDVKTGNIIVDSGNVAKLIDFGLATTETPISGSMRGTIGYAAPEVVRGELGDPRSDLYSLGVVYYEVLAGKRPFAGRDGTDYPAPPRA